MLKISNSSKHIPAFFFKSKYYHKLPLGFQSRPISTSTTITAAPVPTHQHITHLILEQRSAKHALDTFRWASNLPQFTHNQSTYRALLHKLCIFRRFDTVKKLLDEMPSSIGSPPDEGIFVTIIRGLGRARMTREVIEVLGWVSKFEKKPTLKLYNSILDVLVKEDIDIAREFYRKKMMGSGVHGDNYTFGILMKGLCLTNRIGDGFKLLQVMKTRGVTPNTVVYNTLIHALCKNGKLGIGRARSLMNEMVEPNDVTFNVLITAYCREDNIVQALVMLEKCFNLGFVPDVVTVTKVMEVLCIKNRAMEAVEVLERVESKGGEIDVVAYNTLIKGFCKLKKAKVACRFLKEMEYKGCLPNVDTYNALISGFCDIGSLDLGLDMFNEMKVVGINWNFITYDTLIRGFCSGGRMEDGFKILELMEESRGGSNGHISPYNSIIYGLYKESRIDEALEFLTKMGKLFPKVVDRSLKILGFSQEGSIENAKGVYDQMTVEGGIPSILVYISLIRGFCDKNIVREAFDMMNEMACHGYFPDVSTLNALINSLCKVGKGGSALKFLEDMIAIGCVPDSESYSPLVNVLCAKGDFHKAFILFTEMLDKGNIPSYLSWNSLVLCLSRERAWLEGNNLYHVNDMVHWILDT